MLGHLRTPAGAAANPQAGINLEFAAILRADALHRDGALPFLTPFFRIDVDTAFGVEEVRQVSHQREGINAPDPLADTCGPAWILHHLRIHPVFKFLVIELARDRPARRGRLRLRQYLLGKKPGTGGNRRGNPPLFNRHRAQTGDLFNPERLFIQSGFSTWGASIERVMNPGFRACAGELHQKRLIAITGRLAEGHERRRPRIGDAVGRSGGWLQMVARVTVGDIGILRRVGREKLVDNALAIRTDERQILPLPVQTEIGKVLLFHQRLAVPGIAENDEILSGAEGGSARELPAGQLAHGIGQIPAAQVDGFTALVVELDPVFALLLMRCQAASVGGQKLVDPDPLSAWRKPAQSHPGKESQAE